jgi:hypothetical protein
MRAVLFIVVAMLLLPPLALAEPRDAVPVRVEEGVSAKVGETLDRAVPSLLRLYAALLDAEPRDLPAVSVAWQDRAESERRVAVRRVAGGGVQVVLGGRDWADPPPEALAPLLEGVARELARTWNDGIYRPDSGLPPWVTEGNAELLGTAALLRLGLATPGDTARRVNVALNNCFAVAGVRPWNAARRDPAGVAGNCGLALHFVIVALAQHRDPSLDTFAFWRGFWKAHPRYGERTLVDYVAATAPGETADFVSSVLAGSSASVGAILVGGIRSALGIDLPNPPPHVYASQALTHLMQHDCGGAMGFWTNNDHLFTDAVAGCGFFKGGWKLRYMAGRDLLKEPQEAVRAAKAACARDKVLVFRTLDGQELKMPCDDAVAATLPGDLRVANLQPLRVARVMVRQ